jgi:DNA-binding transcriptional LysR family regulator
MAQPETDVNPLPAAWTCAACTTCRRPWRRRQPDGGCAVLGLSQPTLSASIKSLEAELGVPLLERHRHGVHATRYAELLLAHARRVDAELQAATTGLQRLRQAEAISLRIGCGPSEATRLLPQALALLRQAQPACASSSNTASTRS